MLSSFQARNGAHGKTFRKKHRHAAHLCKAKDAETGLALIKL